MRLLINCILLILSLFFFIPSSAKTTLETLPHDGDHSVIAMINSATHTLQITMYGFTDRKIARALIQQQAQGINVQLLIEHSPYQASGENTKIIKQLKKAHISIHYASSHYLLTHQKTLLIDKQRAIIMTGNFTYSGFYRQRNFIVKTNNPNVVENLSQLFNTDWNKTTNTLPPKDSALVLSPKSSWQAIKKLIENAHYKLDIYALELTDDRVIQTLLKQKVNIRIIISRSTKITSKNKFCQSHIDIHRLNMLDQHAKALLRDYNHNNALAYVGSANLSYPSLSKNREAGMLFSDKAALNTLNAAFEKDWRNSTSIC